ncbi:exported hypothetical protein [Agrobacterium tumefaciens str. Kerr 14]|uniref:Uncharacterized protein n=1 Tax=Agrobacterium tumefaciens str. Kerr 14 TaxID=1183424 RepID=A0A1S7RAU1_AGRTU|nr:hypothetical protein At12D1_47370 [Agrobacterium tumefaciens]CUX49708.1 exported hypothetical protein [Agrobacterium tumefaciens str. Kerr 14]
MKHLKLCLIAVAAIAASTFAQAEQKAMKSDVTIASDINYLLYTPKDYASSDRPILLSSGCMAAIRAAATSKSCAAAACRN